MSITSSAASFSFADLEAAVGIRKASVHYHFPTKADLGVAKTKAGAESAWARSRVVQAANAAGVQAIDSVYGDVGERTLKEIAERMRDDLTKLDPKDLPPPIPEGRMPEPEGTARLSRANVDAALRDALRQARSCRARSTGSSRRRRASL